jgi:DNA-binding LacI/PurR family transcriptional regulator
MQWMLDIIEEIEEGCREAKLEPICAPSVEVLRRCSPEQRESAAEVLNSLYVDGKIKVWKGINDKIIQTI